MGTNVVRHFIFCSCCLKCGDKERDCLTVKISGISQRHTEHLSLFSFMTVNKHSKRHEPLEKCAMRNQNIAFWINFVLLYETLYSNTRDTRE